MRFHCGAIPTSPDFVPDASWKSLREIRPWLVQFIALPIGIVTAGLVAILWLAITPLRLAAFAITPMSFLVSFVGIVVVHELIHAAVHPLAARLSRSILGFWPSCGLFYAHYDGELSRNRSLAVLLMPLFVISIVPLLVAAVLQSAAGWVAFISCFNALLACGGVLGVALLLFQIPANATVRNQGWRTYWKKHESRASGSCTAAVQPDARAEQGTCHIR